jgi:hypothetical protein
MDGKPVVYLHPVGPLEKDDVDAMLRQARKAIGLAVEMGPPVAVPAGALDGLRGQIIAFRLLAAVPATPDASPPPLTGHTTYGGLRPPGPPPGVTPPSPAGAGPPPPNPGPVPAFARIAVTDQDLFVPGQEFVLTMGDAKGRRAVLSTRRLKESFYKRKADPAKQHGRAAREFISAIGAARGLLGCHDPYCVMAESHTVMDVDRKNDRFCGHCNNLIHGRLRW